MQAKDPVRWLTPFSSGEGYEDAYLGINLIASPSRDPNTIHLKVQSGILIPVAGQ